MLNIISPFILRLSFLHRNHWTICGCAIHIRFYKKANSKKCNRIRNITIDFEHICWIQLSFFRKLPFRKLYIETKFIMHINTRPILYIIQKIGKYIRGCDCILRYRMHCMLKEVSAKYRDTPLVICPKPKPNFMCTFIIRS